MPVDEPDGMNMQPGNLESRDALDIRELLALLWAGRWWIVASVTLVTVATVAAAFLMTPVYRASIVLVSASEDRNSLSSSLGSSLGSLSGLAALAGVSISPQGSATEEALAVLRSRQFSESFIEDYKLMPQFFPNEWDSKLKQWKVIGEQQPTTARAYKFFDRKIRKVGQDKRTGLVTLHIDWRDRVAAAAWANELVKRLNTEMRRRAISQSDASLGFLQRELSSTSVVESRNAISRLMEAQINERMIANVTEEYSFRVVDPAMVPDKKDWLRPRRLLMALSGLIIGVLVGVVVAVLFRRPN